MDRCPGNSCTVPADLSLFSDRGGTRCLTSCDHTLDAPERKSGFHPGSSPEIRQPHPISPESAIPDVSEYPLPGLPCNGNAGSKNNHRDYGPAGSSGSKDDVCKWPKALSFSDVSEFHNDNRVPPACPSRYEVSKSHASCSTP